MIQVIFIHQPHDPEFFFSLAKGLIIEPTPVYTYKFALITDAQCHLAITHLKSISYRPSFFKFFLDTPFPSPSAQSWHITFQGLYLPFSPRMPFQIFPEPVPGTLSSSEISCLDVSHIFLIVHLATIVPVLTTE